MAELEINKALEEIRKNSKERKFDQSVELIVNLKKYDVKKNPINVFVNLPNKIKDKKICGFIESKSDLVDVIPKASFPIYKDKKKVKNLVKKYDFFIASGPNMPAVATTFGRVLGPAGKMPSPKLGIVMTESPEAIKEVVEKIDSATRIQTKEPCVKIAIGKEKMEDAKISANIQSAYKIIVKELPLGKDNVRNIMIKLTMGKPIKVKL